MLCKLLKYIYLDEIHKSLDKSELAQFSYIIQQEYIDLWNSCTHIGTHPDFPERLFYVKDGLVWFELFYNKLDICIYIYIYSKPYYLLYNKYNFQNNEFKSLTNNIFKSKPIQFNNLLPNIIFDIMYIINNTKGVVGFLNCESVIWYGDLDVESRLNLTKVEVEYARTVNLREIKSSKN